VCVPEHCLHVLLGIRKHVLERLSGATVVIEDARVGTVMRDVRLIGTKTNCDHAKNLILAKVGKSMEERDQARHPWQREVRMVPAPFPAVQERQSPADRPMYMSGAAGGEKIWTAHCDAPQPCAVEVVAAAAAAAAREMLQVWVWYQDVVHGFVLHSAGFFACTSQCCGKSATLIHVPRPQGAAVSSGEGDGRGVGLCREASSARAMCKRCGTRVCEHCTWKARRMVALHVPLSCQLRVLVEAYVARIEVAMEDLDRKHTAATVNTRVSVSSRHARPSAHGGKSSQDGEPVADASSAAGGASAVAKLPTSAPSLAELIELLGLLGRTEEVKTLRQVEDGSYVAPAAPVAELR